MTRSLFVLFLACAGAAHADIWHIGDLITYSQADWGGEPSLPDPGGVPLVASYDTVYSSTFGVVTVSGGLGGEVLGLDLNVDFSGAGLLPGATGLRFGDLVLANFSTPTFNGLTVLSAKPSRRP